MRQLSLRTLILSLAAMSLVTSCVKERPTIEAQGTNLGDLVKISEIHNKTCTITTAPAINGQVLQTERSSDAVEGINVEKNNFSIQFFDIVKIAKSDCPSVMENQEVLNFRGLPGKTYNMIYRVDQNFLTLFKVVSKDEVSHYEMPYSEKINNFFYVPVGGFDITGFSNVVFQKNGDNRNTNVKTKISVAPKNYTQASHLSIDETKFKRFESINKKNVFPAGYFNGEWYFSSTVIKNKYSSKGIVGNLSASDTNNQHSSRIKFVQKQDMLFLVNQNIDEQLRDEKNLINYEFAAKIPVVATDYKRSELGTGKGFQETNLNSLKPTDAKYLELDLKETQLASNSNRSAIASLLSAVQNFVQTKELKEVSVGEDYFTYLLQDGSDQNLVRYSFKRVPKKSTYMPKIAFREDFNYFGFFDSQKQRVLDHTIDKDSDIQANSLMKRFNLNSGPIVFRFSQLTPRGSENEWVRDIARESINFWQQAFERASGEKREFITLIETCDKPDKEMGCDVPLGDIRFNSINYVDAALGDFVGFGPSLHDPITGEIVSATMNLTLYNVREEGYRIIRSYIHRRIGHQRRLNNLETDSILDPRITRLFGIIDLGLFSKSGNITEPYNLYSWTDSRQTDAELKPLITNDEIQALSNVSSGPGLKTTENFDQLMSGMFEDDQLSGRSIMNAEFYEAKKNETLGAGLDNFIFSQCGAVTQFIAQHQSTQQALPTTEEENEVMESCVKKYMVARSLRTTVHEIGHNLGLRHNFMGSYDKANYSKPDDFEFKFVQFENSFFKPGLSSIMDYEDFEDGINVYPGGYDIAALRFGYFGKLAVKPTGSSDESSYKLADVSPDRSIPSFLNERGLAAKPFHFCSDSERHLRVSTHCDAFDIGGNPLEVAQKTIESIQKIIPAYTYRYDKMDIATLSLASRFIKLKQIYEDWRRLVANETGTSRAHLRDFSASKYQTEVIDKILKKDNNQEAIQLFKARNLIVAFLLEMAFTPNKYCVVSPTSDVEKSFYYELSRVRSDLGRSGHSGPIFSCSQDIVKNHLLSRGLNVKSEIGHYLESGSFNLNPPRNSIDDFAGTWLLRANASYILFNRSYYGFTNRQEDFSVSTLDEPDLRDALTNVLEKRLLSGPLVPKKAFKSDDYSFARLISAKELSARFDDSIESVNFDSESSFLLSMYKDFIKGLKVPNDINESLNRLVPFETTATGQPDSYKNLKKRIMLNSTTYLLTPGTDHFSTRLLNKVIKLRSNRAHAKAPFSSLDDFKYAFNSSTSFKVEEMIKMFLETKKALTNTKQGDGTEILTQKFNSEDFLLNDIVTSVARISSNNMTALIDILERNKPEDVSDAGREILAQDVLRSDIEKALTLKIKEVKALRVKESLFADELEAQENLLIKVLLQ